MRYRVEFEAVDPCLPCFLCCLGLSKLQRSIFVNLLDIIFVGLSLQCFQVWREILYF